MPAGTPSTSSTQSPPILSDGVLTLRAVAMADADDITQACQDPEIQRWTLIPVPYAHSDATTWLERFADHAAWWANPTWAITVVPDNRWCGTIDFRPDGTGGAEVGYMVAPWARRQGLMTRTLRLACGWAFGSLGIEVVTWMSLVGNVNSRQAARQAGFRIPEVVLRKALVQRGVRVDAWVGDLLPEDLAAAVRRADARTPYRGSRLTTREIMVLQRLALGESNRAAATALGISENTIKNHVRSILDKLQARSRSEAVVAGLRLGLVSLPDRP